MKSKISFSLFFLVMVAVICIGFPFFSLSAEKAPVEKKEEANAVEEKKVVEEKKATLIELYSWATILPKELIDLKNSLQHGKSIAVIEEELAALAEEMDGLQRDMAAVEVSPDLSILQVKNSAKKLYNINTQLKKLSETITAAINDLLMKRAEWQARKDQIAGYDKTEMLDLALAEEQQKQLTETVEQAVQLIQEQLKQNLAIGKEIGDHQILLYSIDISLQKMKKAVTARSREKTSVSILSSEFYAQVNADLFRQSYANVRQFFADQLADLTKNSKLVLFNLFLFFIIYLAIYKTNSLITASSHWYAFSCSPLATTFFIISSSYTFMDTMQFGFDLPVQLKALLKIMIILAAIPLTQHTIDKKLRRFFVYLVIIMAIAMSMVVFEFSRVFQLLYVFYVSCIALVYYLYQIPRNRGKKGFEVWLRRIMGLLPAAVLLYISFGYNELAVVFFYVVLSTIIACLVIWVLYLFHYGLVELMLTISPFSFDNEQRERTLHNVRPIIVCLHIFLLILVEGVVLDLYPSGQEVYAAIFVTGFDFLNIHFVPGFLLSVILVIYFFLLVSRAVKTLLLTKILPRYGAQKGVQISITRLAEYMILGIGFLVLLNVLGFEVKQLALLGGALGVGLAFGLQAIVNNFASGLILLFERPVKVGDTIQVGTEIGEVKNLGLRATIIQTYDNAEIVVPNSDLITGQVTNWTLAERRVRVRVPVGVAYGTDVAKVLKILLACAEANPVVLSTPKATVFFVAFGASSLDFELRVWISEYLDKMQVLSDLNQDIESEFTLNNIEIPFPQVDLHLRSVDKQACDM